MKKNIDTTLNKLKSASKFKNDKDYHIFSECIEELKKTRTIEVLHILFECLNDKDAGEIQYELIEACEEYSDKIYVEEFIQYSNLLRKNAREWYIIMLQTILNTASTKKVFLSVYNSLLDKDLKLALCNDVKKIAKEGDEYKNILGKMK